MNDQLELFRSDTERTVMSRDRLYRYTLWRRWSVGKRYVQFIGLNPSTADESSNDPTIRKCVKFARIWGFDAMCMTNLFAFRSTDKRVMMRFADPVGYGNDRWLTTIAENASIIVAAWSRDGAFNNRSKHVCNLLAERDLYCLRITQTQPWHPLYLPDATRPRLWRPADRQPVY